MAKVSSVETATQVDVGRATPQLRMPDAGSTAKTALTDALKFCAEKMGLSSHAAVLEHLRKGDSRACDYCHYSIAKHVADSLGALDRNVKAVYVVDYDATPEDVCYGGTTQTSPIHLIVWVGRQTSALNSLTEALDRALVERFNEVIGTHHLVHMLDVQVVDDADVENRVGYGAMLTSLHQRPIQVWKR
jgi:hypothetical protein